MMQAFQVHRAQGRLGRDIRDIIRSGGLSRPCLLETRLFDEEEGGKDIFFCDPPLLIEGRGRHLRVSALNARGQALLPLFHPPSPDMGALAYLDHLCAQFRGTVFAEFGLTGALPHDFAEAEPGEGANFCLYFADAVFLLDSGSDRYQFRAIGAEAALAGLACLPAQLAARPARPDGPPLRFGPLEGPPQDRVIAMLRAGLGLIDSGALHQLTLSRRYSLTYAGNPFELYGHYAAANPTSHNYYLDFGRFGFFGASIATQLKQNAGRLSTIAIGGTTRRHAQDPSRQAEGLARLLTSGKERDELDMLVDLARNDLTALSGQPALVSNYRHFSYHSRVVHTYARITAPAPPDLPIFAALARTMPAGTVSGYPRATACRAIARLEPEHRGFYGGAIGHAGFSGEFDMSVGIRGVTFDAQRMSFQVGSTLVARCDPVEEYHEAEQKAAGFLDTLRRLRPVNAAPAPVRPALPRLRIDDPQDRAGALYAAARGPDARGPDLRLVLSWPAEMSDGDIAAQSGPFLAVGDAAWELVAARPDLGLRRVPVEGRFDWRDGHAQAAFLPSYRHCLLAAPEGGNTREIGETSVEGGILFRLEGDRFLCLIDPLSTAMVISGQSENALAAILGAVARLLQPEPPLSSPVQPDLMQKEFVPCPANL
ncbi:chorismate-binding protein [Gemmobacter caeruleus]|uniref:chorismate-binding protein n=1 Tax=Gemmobacter caeruleus TaxID=2595004 RepID=UPI0011EE7465|nr:chorismate-binding protein [Gemmobacter caeruleus]